MAKFIPKVFIKGHRALILDFLLGLGLLACTEQPKVERAAVTKPSPSPRAAAADKLVATATPTAEPTATSTAEPAAKLTPEPTATSTAAPAMEVNQKQGLLASELSSLENETAKWGQFCEKGNSVACMRYGAYLQMAQKSTEAIAAYLRACTNKPEPPQGKCQAAQDPTVKNARGCYNAALIAAQDSMPEKNRDLTKILLTCACEMLFTQACADIK